MTGGRRTLMVAALAGMAARHLGPSWWAQRAAAEHGPR